ncbi:MAG: stage 0 sporulation protein [Firmicutes bacterium]|nr:stage 0 sporulation protein [Bacillota bacterium]
MRKTVNVKIAGIVAPARYDTDIPVKNGDIVIVESPNGAEWGEVCSEPIESKSRHGENNLIIRVADERDLNSIKELKAGAKRALRIANEKVEKHKLEMKPLSAYYTMDGGKIIIQFAAEKRVDFRELVRDLAFTLKARIELKQIGARDEVKVTGALGPCGEICCCVRFGTCGQNITIKMAKTQGLSLNPQKINGMCGRLLCCLAYENNHYAETSEKMPRYGSEVQTPDGRGIAQDHNVIKETVNVKFNNGGEFKVGCYKMCDVKCKGGCARGERQ